MARYDPVAAMDRIIERVHRDWDELERLREENERLREELARKC